MSLRQQRMRKTTSRGVRQQARAAARRGAARRETRTSDDVSRQSAE
jgi:hypothetical protein